MTSTTPLDVLIAQYDPALPLDEASTIPASWYTDPRFGDLERRSTFSRTWQLAGRVDQLRDAGQYVTCEVAGEPMLVVRGDDGGLRGFFNVCRHHAAAVMTQPEGYARNLRCPYHGWTYALDGALKGTPGFNRECGFERGALGLVPVAVATWQQWVFVRLDTQGPTLQEFLGQALVDEVAGLGLERLHWFARRHYSFACNWKVFVDNYLDGGYHVPHLHKGLDSVLDTRGYTITNGRHHCLQASPMASGGEAGFAAVRGGALARYYWLHPNFMFNLYDGMMDSNLVLPVATDRTDVVFDYWFEDVSDAARERNLASIAVSDIIQDEDMAICKSVQRGLRSRAYSTGRLSARREAGEHLFHRLLHADLVAGRRAGCGGGMPRAASFRPVDACRGSLPLPNCGDADMTGHRQDGRQGEATRGSDVADRQEGQQTDLDRGHGVKGQGGQEASRGVPEMSRDDGDDAAGTQELASTQPGQQGGLSEEFGDLDDGPGDGEQDEGLPGHLGGGMVGG